MSKLTLTLAAGLLAAGTAAAQAIVLTENFGSTGFVAPAGWTFINNSQSPDETWGQPDPPFTEPDGFAAHQGGQDAFISAGFASTNPDVPNITSNWLITPQVTLTPSGRMIFFTRTQTANVFGDRMQVWFSPTGGTSVGPNPVVGTPNTTPGDVPQNNGNFTALLLDINPNEVQTNSPGAYPEVWTQFEASILGLNLTGPVNGRFGFRYYNEDSSTPRTGTGGTRPFANFVGVDTVTIDAVPEPGSFALAGMAVVAGGAYWRRKRTPAAD